MDKDSSHAVGSKKGNTHESNSEIESDDYTSTSPATTRKPISTASSHAVGSKKGDTHESDSELESESDDTIKKIDFQKN